MSNRISTPTKMKIMQLWEDGASIVEIADRLGLARSTVEHTIKSPSKDVWLLSRKAPGSVAKRKRACWLRAQGWTLEAIEQATGIKGKDVEAHWRSWAEKYGIELPEPKPEPPVSEVTNDVFIYRMVDGKQVLVGREPFHKEYMDMDFSGKFRAPKRYRSDEEDFNE